VGDLMNFDSLLGQLLINLESLDRFATHLLGKIGRDEDDGQPIARANRCAGHE
jgi:hypothetical protein